LTDFTKDPDVLYARRGQVGDMIERLAAVSAGGER
jgi:hypothetical protein